MMYVTSSTVQACALIRRHGWRRSQRVWALGGIGLPSRYKESVRPALQVEHGVVVGIEANYHAAPDLDANVLDAAHLVQQGAVLVRQVLNLLGLAKRVLVGGLDADEQF
jgi:hypothetical protein